MAGIAAVDGCDSSTFCSSLCKLLDAPSVVGFETACSSSLMFMSLPIEYSHNDPVHPYTKYLPRYPTPNHQDPKNICHCFSRASHLIDQLQASSVIPGTATSASCTMIEIPDATFSSLASLSPTSTLSRGCASSCSATFSYVLLIVSYSCQMKDDQHMNDAVTGFCLPGEPELE